MWDKPFDVLTKKRVADMTSVDWATRLVNECEVRRRKGLPTTDQWPKSEEQKLS